MSDTSWQTNAFPANISITLAISNMTAGSNGAIASVLVDAPINTGIYYVFNLWSTDGHYDISRGAPNGSGGTGETSLTSGSIGTSATITFTKKGNTVTCSVNSDASASYTETTSWNVNQIDLDQNNGPTSADYSNLSVGYAS